MKLAPKVQKHAAQAPVPDRRTPWCPSLANEPDAVAVESFVDTDRRYLENDAGGSKDDGCTAVTAVLVGQRLVVANVGDSRAVLCRAGQGTAL